MKFQLPMGAVFKTVNKIIGKKENVHYVNFIYPDAGLGGELMNFLIKYMLQQQIGPKAGSLSGEIMSLYNSIVKYAYGGMPILGKLIITDEHVTFKPMMYQAIMIKGCKEIVVPAGDIIAVNKEAKWFNSYQFVSVTTICGQFKCVIMPGYTGSSMGDDICGQIQQISNNNNQNLSKL